MAWLLTRGHAPDHLMATDGELEEVSWRTQGELPGSGETLGKDSSGTGRGDQAVGSHPSPLHYDPLIVGVAEEVRGKGWHLLPRKPEKGHTSVLFSAVPPAPGPGPGAQ